MSHRAEDYFAKFGLPWRYDVDEHALEAAYERLSLEHHPDFYADAPPEEKRQAERRSAGFNEAYRVLSSEALRAAYLLELLASERELDREALPKGFLQEIFELQEQTDDLDAGVSGEERTVLREETLGRVNTVRETLRGFFNDAERDGKVRDAETDLLQRIQSELNCWRYLERLLERLA